MNSPGIKHKTFGLVTVCAFGSKYRPTYCKPFAVIHFFDKM